MTVYVDDMRAPFGRMIMCHMVADSEAELHAMADRIGVARKWYQGARSAARRSSKAGGRTEPASGGDHYDISLSRRAIAVQHGAVEVTQRQLGAMVANRRALGVLGDPAAAEQILIARLKLRRPQVTA